MSARDPRIQADEDHFGAAVWSEVQPETGLSSHVCAWFAVCVQEEKAAVQEENADGIRRGKYPKQRVFV